MGKAADNERLKLRATFYNNTAVGFALTGFAVPFITFFYHGDKARPLAAKMLTFALTIDDYLSMGDAFFGALFAFLFAGYFRSLCNTTIRKLAD